MGWRYISFECVILLQIEEYKLKFIYFRKGYIFFFFFVVVVLLLVGMEEMFLTIKWHFQSFNCSSQKAPKSAHQ